MSDAPFCSKHETLETGIAKIDGKLDRMVEKIDSIKDQLRAGETRMELFEHRLAALEAAERNRAQQAGQHANDWRKVGLDLMKNAIWAASCFAMGHFMTKGG